MSNGNYLTTARKLIGANTTKARQADLKRAISTIYYAMFHTLAGMCADMTVGTAQDIRKSKAWRHAYRALNHGEAKSACKDRTINHFDLRIVNFAELFILLQEDRHNADYDPHANVVKSQCITRLNEAETVIAELKQCSVVDRRAFAIWVLMYNKKRN